MNFVDNAVLRSVYCIIWNAINRRTNTMTSNNTSTRTNAFEEERKILLER